MAFHKSLENGLPFVCGTFYIYTMARYMHIQKKASKVYAHLCRVWKRTEDREPASPVDGEEQESEQYKELRKNPSIKKEDEEGSARFCGEL